VGYPYGKKGCKLYDLESKEIFVSRDVEFCDDIFPFEKEKSVQKQSMPNGVTGPNVLDDPMRVEYGNNDDVNPIENVDRIQGTIETGPILHIPAQHVSGQQQQGSVFDDRGSVDLAEPTGPSGPVQATDVDNESERLQLT